MIQKGFTQHSFPTSCVTLPMRGFKVCIISVLCLFMFASASFAFVGLQKSSKKECALCHVMWLDTFRTNRETLIKWQPGNVLMKDTQGIVSSEDMCYSCHDGYVVDSRYVVWKGNNHTTFKKPSEKVRIPETLTLSNKDEIYCGTCHSPHSGREAAPGMSAEETIPGPLSFLRLPNTNSELCEACHVEPADYQRTHGHPVHTDKLKIPEKLFDAGGLQGDKKNMVICQSCHRVHGASGKNLTVVDNTASALCVICHKQRAVTGTQHDLRLTMPDKTNIKGQTPVESGPCGACHLPHDGAGIRLWAEKITPDKPASELCLSCHKGAPENKITGIGKFSHPNNVAAVSKKDGPINTAQLTDKLPFYSSKGTVLPMASGTIQCFTCHDAHQWDPESPDKKGEKDVKGNASNSFLRIAASRDSALCVECHRDKRGILSNDHNLTVTAPDAKNIRGMTALASGPCGACHIPHNAAGKQLWAGMMSEENPLVPEYCMGCHTEDGAAGKKPVGKADHPVDLVANGEHIPSVDRIAKGLPLYNKEGEIQGGNRIMCRTCHEPHHWSPASAAFESANLKKEEPADASSRTDTRQPENREGDASNSFLRKIASPGSDLCVVCHPDTAILAGTDHDLFITAPDSKNQKDQTVAESGQCGVCHAVHNSPEKRLLWAAAYGPVAENQHPMNGVCTGCHSKNGIAEGKIPPTAIHPSGQLITNIMRNDHQPTGYIKIFDKDWKEVNVGDLSCSSCHSFYQWDHRVKQPGDGRNTEGDADTSFLRTSSDRAVCIDCHGESAIWRYLYFHSVKKREMLKRGQPSDGGFAAPN